MIIGYARVSTDDQNLDAQTDALNEAGVQRIYADKISGSKRDRAELSVMLDQLRPGDVIGDRPVWVLWRGSDYPSYAAMAA